MVGNIDEAKQLLEQGIIKSYIKDYDLGIKLTIEAYDYFNKIEDADNTAVCLCELALMYYYNSTSGFAKSNDLLKEAYDIISNKKHKVETEAKILIFYGIINYKEKNFSDALKYYKYAEKLLSNNTETLEYTQLLDNMAIFYLRSDNFQIATRYLIQSHVTKEKIGEKREAAITKLLLGRHFSAVENYGEAIWYLMQVVNVFSEYKDTLNTARVKDEIAKIYLNLGVYSTAREFCESSINLSLNVNDPMLRAFSRCTLAHIEILSGNFEIGLNIIDNQVLPVFTELLSTRGYAMAKRVQAVGYYWTNKCEEAVSAMNEAIKIFKDQEMYGDTVRCLLELGNIYRICDEKFLSVSSYKLALKIAHFNNLPLLTKRLEDIIFDLDEEEWADVINENAKKDKTLGANILAESLDLEKNAGSVENKLRTSLYSLLKIGRAIAAESDVDKLLTIIASETKKALRADRCTVFLYDKEKNELYSKVALGMGSEIRIPCDEGLAGHVFKTGESINIKEAYNDFRFNSNVDKKTGYKTNTILSMPMRNLNHEIIGVFQVLNKLDNNKHFTEDDEELLISISSSAGIAIENARLHHKQQLMYYEQKQSFTSFINTLAASIDAKDKITSGHSKRVTSYSMAIAEQMELEKEDIEVLEYAAILHDFGKIGIKDSVLCKKGKLTDEEYSHIKQHAYITNEILNTMFFEEKFKDVPAIAASHHEKYDGKGYFKGLKGEDIPLGGRIIAISDVFDAITSKRHYRNCMPFIEVLNIIKTSAWSHFDGNIVEKFFNIKLDRIVSVLLTRTNQQKFPERDKKLFKKYTLLDLHKMLNTPEQDRSKDDEKLIALFDKYYDNLDDDE